MLPVEEPEFIRRSISLLEKRGLSSVQDIAFQLALSEVEVIDLVGINHRMEESLSSDVQIQGRATRHRHPATIPFPM